MKEYMKLDMHVLTLMEQDVVRTSGGFFGDKNEGDEDGFGNPNDEGDPALFEN